MKKQKISKNKESEDAIKELIKDHKKDLFLLRDKQRLIFVEENLKENFKE